jgi:ZIP family zinc transporter
MSVWTAIAWGAATSASLWLGQALARPMSRAPRVTGLVMGFGAGTLLSAIAYQLVPRTSLDNDAVIVALGLLAGALVYYGVDRILDRTGGADRQRIRPEPSAGGTSLAMFLGALLDGVPESLVLGIGIAAGGSVSAAFVMAVLVSNIPQGVAGTASLAAAGHGQRRIFLLWGGLTVACAITAGAGFLIGDGIGRGGSVVEAFAAGAVLMVLADSMIPEAYTHGGRAVGLATVAGYLAATALASDQPPCGRTAC